MKRSSPTVLMCVYNPIEFDGRVQRSARGLSSWFDVDVVSVHSGGDYQDPSFSVRTVRLPASGPKPWRHLWFTARLCAIALRRRPTVLYAHDYFMAFPGWLAARLSGARFVYDAHELIFPARGERLGRRDQFWYRLERAVIRRAQLVVAANAERAELMREHFGLAERPMIVRNIAAPPVRRSNEEEVLRRYPSLRRTSADEVLAIYQGDMSLARGLSIFLDAAVLLPPHVRLILAGGAGPGRDRGADRQAGPARAGRRHRARASRRPPGDPAALRHRAHLVPDAGPEQHLLRAEQDLRVCPGGVADDHDGPAAVTRGDGALRDR